MPSLEFYFDCSSPWTYLAFQNIQPLAAETGLDIAWKPFLVGGVFNTVNPSVYASREHPVEAKVNYARKDLADWARLAGLEIRMPPKIFPINSVKAMRGCLVAAEQAKLVPFASAVFAAYWGDDRDIADDDVLSELAEAAGLDRTTFFAGIGDQRIKDLLRANTEDVIARGGFGSPTMFLKRADGRDDIYFGNDRLPLIRAALARAL